MTKISINNCIPDKLSEVVDCRDIPIDHTTDTYKERVLNVIRKLFSIPPKTSKSLDEYDLKYYENEDFLWKTIKNPNNILGVVCIDGYARSKNPEHDDIGLVLNMGIPKLRARKFHKLDRIYVHMEKSGNNDAAPILQFYNSPYDNDDNEQVFSFKTKIPAWHPHLSNGNACLGGYETRLYTYKNRKQVLMYIKTINQFLLTWNRRSPFWHLEGHTAPKRENYGNNESVPLSKYLNALGLNYGDNIVTHFKNFCQNYYNSIKFKEDMTPYDVIFYLSIVYSICQKNVYNLRDNITGRRDVNELNGLALLTSEMNYSNTGIGLGSIIDTSKPLFRINHLSKMNKKDPIKTRKQVKYRSNQFTDPKTSGFILSIKRILNTYGRTGTRVYEDCMSNKIYGDIVFDPNHVHKVMKLTNDYLIPLRLKMQKECDELVLSKKIISKPFFKVNHFNYSGKSEVLVNMGNKWTNRLFRILNLTNTMADKNVNDEFIVKYINNRFKTDFNLIIEKQEYERWDSNKGTVVSTVENMISENSGKFWYNFNCLTTEERTEQALKLLENNLPTNYNEYIINYNNILNKLYESESNIIIQSLNKIKKEIINGLQTNNTKKSTQQVPLFFD
jgi:hypothetical protein